MFVKNKEALASETFVQGSNQFNSNNSPIYRGNGKGIDYSKVKPSL